MLYRTKGSIIGGTEGVLRQDTARKAMGMTSSEAIGGGKAHISTRETSAHRAGMRTKGGWKASRIPIRAFETA